MDRIGQIIADTIDQWEGGFVDHPADRGGPTNMGITAKTYAAWLGRPVTTVEVRVMPREHAVEIYRERYWHTACVGRLPEPLWPVVFDCSVNHGPAQAIRLVQAAVSHLGQATAVDGRLGPATLNRVAAAVAVHGASAVINAICDQRQQFYQALVDERPDQRVFLKGWLRRCAAFRM